MVYVGVSEVTFVVEKLLCTLHDFLEKVEMQGMLHSYNLQLACQKGDH